MQTKTLEGHANIAEHTYRLAMLVREVSSLTVTTLDETLRKMGITGQQMLVFKLIAHAGQVSHGELCRAMNLSKGTVSGILSRMQARGWVKKEASSQDLRSHLFSFTAQGNKMADELHELMADPFQRLFHGSDPQDIARFETVLREMLGLIRKNLGAAGHSEPFNNSPIRSES